MQNLNFPLSFRFKVTTLANDFVVTDAQGAMLAYVRQKMMKWVDEVQVFSDESKSNQIYTIKANKWMDFSATYAFTNANGMEVGRVARKGWASIWKARYEIYDEKQQQDLLIQEENPWAKVGDALFSEIPFLGLLTGLLFHPKYKVARPDGTIVARLRKDTSLLGRQFYVDKVANFEKGEEERIMLGLMMMILLERRRG